MRHVVLTVATPHRGAAGLAVLLLLAACGSGGSTSPTSPALAGPPPPTTTLPAWLPRTLGVAGEQALLEVIRHDLATRGMQYSFDEPDGTIVLANGIVVPLSDLARAASQSDPTTWPDLVARTLDGALGIR